jgi:hypothetical protein
MINTDKAKELTPKYEKFQAVIPLLSCVPLTVACQLQLRCDCAARRTRSAVADPFSNATPLRQLCDSAAMALQFSDMPYSFIAALSQQN